MELPRRTSTLAGMLLVASLGPTSCGLPRDPEGTLDRAPGDVLPVGAVDSPPLLVREGDGARGPEAEPVLAFARRIDARVEWLGGPMDDHMRALEEFELVVVAAGLTEASPWRSRVGFTRPWRVEGGRRHVLAVPPGENRLLASLERVIEERRSAR